MARVKLSSFSIFSLFYLVFIVNSVKCNVPVLLWESSSISDKDDLIPALYQLDSDEFSNHLVKKIHQHKPLVVLFLEESLSVEDFSWKDDHGQGSFPQLQNLTSMSAKTEFVTSVYDPVAALRDLAESQDYTWVKFDGKKLPAKSHAVLEVRMEDPSADEDRPELLRRHDGSIAETYSRLLSQYSHIVALFTGKYSSWVEPEYNRVRREVDEYTNSSDIFDLTVEFPDKTFSIIRSSKPPTLITDGNETTLQNPLKTFADSKKGGIRFLVANFPDKTHLRFTFTESGSYWTLASVTLNDSQALMPSSDISKPVGTPFKTDTPIEFSAGTTKLMFKDLQISPSNNCNYVDANQLCSDAPQISASRVQRDTDGNLTDQVQSLAKSNKFGENPPVYFTIPILMGIFVTVILAIILSWAIIMMMDIRTMDRFDDPKGKTITVAQAE